MTPTEIAQAILASRPLTRGGDPLDSRAIAEMLRYQTRKGTVRRVSHGVYVFVPGLVAAHDAMALRTLGTLVRRGAASTRRVGACARLDRQW